MVVFDIFPKVRMIGVEVDDVLVALIQVESFTSWPKAMDDSHIKDNGCHHSIGSWKVLVVLSQK